MDDDTLERHLPVSEPTFHILLTLGEGAMHGYGVILEVERRTGGTVQLGTGTVYSVIKRLRSDGLITEVRAPDESDDSRRRYYAATELGRRVVEAEAQRYARLAALARSSGVLPA